MTARLRRSSPVTTSHDKNHVGTLANSQLGLFVFLAACLAFVLVHLYVLPFASIYYEGDHIPLLNDAKRIVHGEFTYRDFFEVQFPGTHMLYAALMYIFGERFWILGAVIAAHCVLAAALATKISKEVVGGGVIKYLPAAIFVFAGFRWFGLDGEHRFLAPLFIYAAILVLMRDRGPWRIACAGALCAGATMFSQNRGAMAVAGIGLALGVELLFRERDLRKFVTAGVVLTASYFLVLAVLLLPALIIAGPAAFFDQTVVFLSTYANDPQFNGIGTYFLTAGKMIASGAVVGAVTIFYLALIPLVYVAGLVALWIRRRTLDRKVSWSILLLCMVGMLCALGNSGPNIYRLYQVAIPALIVFVWLLSPLLRRHGLIPSAILAALILFGTALAIRTHSSWQFVYLDTPSGRLAFSTPAGAERFLWFSQNARSHDVVFEVYGAYVNFPLNHRNPSRLSVLLNSGYSPPPHVAWALEDLKREKPRYIIWDGAWTPAMRSGGDREPLWPLFSYLTENYHYVRSFTGYDDRQPEVWEVNDPSAVSSLDPP